MSKGWIKIWREDIENNPYWPGKRKQPFTKMEAWLDLSILLAQGVDTETLKKGQAEVSVRFLSKRWQWSMSKVYRWLKKSERFGYLKIESQARNQSENSVLTIFKRKETGTAIGTAIGTAKSLKQEGLFSGTETAIGTAIGTPPRVNARVMGEKQERSNTSPRAEDGSEGCVDRILGHCLDQGPWKGFRVQNSEDAARFRIAKRLEGGYSEEDLIHYVDVYLGRRTAHRRFKNGHDGEEPSPRHRLWCPNPTWSIEELFTRERYFVKWIDDGEEVLTLEKIERIEDQEYEMG